MQEAVAQEAVQKNPELRRIDVLVVTALKTELDALLEVGGGVDSWEMLRDSNGFVYYIGIQGILKVAAACAVTMGETATADRARSLVDLLKPKMLAMCGICAGKKGSLSLGDLIVADRLFSYDHGSIRVAQDSAGKDIPVLLRDVETFNVPKHWIMEVSGFTWSPAGSLPKTFEQQKRDLLEQIKSANGYKTQDELVSKRLEELEKEKLVEFDLNLGGFKLTNDGVIRNARQQALCTATSSCQVKVGPVATGKAVRKDGLVFQEIEPHSRKVLGVEMEGAAIGWVAQISDIPFFLVKGVADFGDLNKDDSFHQFASSASAQFLLDFLSRFPPDWLARKGANLSAANYPAASGGPKTVPGSTPADIPQDWENRRSGIYADCRGLMLVHRLSPATVAGQKHDVILTLLGHKEADLNKVKQVEYYLGGYWGHQVFSGAGPSFSIRVSAYGPFLCLCKITFTDGAESFQSRYIDFELEGES